VRPVTTMGGCGSARQATGATGRGSSGCKESTLEVASTHPRWWLLHPVTTGSRVQPSPAPTPSRHRLFYLGLGEEDPPPRRLLHLATAGSHVQPSLAPVSSRHRRRSWFGGGGSAASSPLRRYGRPTPTSTTSSPLRRPTRSASISFLSSPLPLF
jgi:hypothetical protein